MLTFKMFEEDIYPRIKALLPEKSVKFISGRDPYSYEGCILIQYTQEIFYVGERKTPPYSHRTPKSRFSRIIVYEEGILKKSFNIPDHLANAVLSPDASDRIVQALIKLIDPNNTFELRQRYKSREIELTLIRK